MSFILQIVLALLILSWLSIYLAEKRNIFRIWITPVKQRLNEFYFGFVLMGTLSLLTQLLFTLIHGTNWTISDELTISKFLYSSAYDFSSVVFEELLFRGVLLYLLIAYLNEHKAIAISAIAFGIYHWFTYGIWGNLLGMTLVIITTGFMGYVFAKAYSKTNSVMLPIGLHIGWNWINNSVFSNGPNGNVFLLPNQTFAMEGY